MQKVSEELRISSALHIISACCRKPKTRSSISYAPDALAQLAARARDWSPSPPSFFFISLTNKETRCLLWQETLDAAFSNSRLWNFSMLIVLYVCGSTAKRSFRWTRGVLHGHFWKRFSTRNIKNKKVISTRHTLRKKWLSKGSTQALFNALANNLLCHRKLHFFITCKYTLEQVAYQPYATLR